MRANPAEEYLMQISDELLTTIEAEVRRPKKYSSISPDLIRQIVALEIPKSKNVKEVIKATRNKIHQVGASFQETTLPYASWIQKLEQLPDNLQSAQVLDFVRVCLPYHASTHERMPFMDQFFQQTLSPVGPISSILDMACGLTPLCLPWMPVTDNIQYTGVDIYQDMVSFLDQFFAHFHIKHHFSVENIVKKIPQGNFQLALLLKTIPCLEQVDKSIGRKLFEGIKAENILVSFPSRSLAGRSKGMATNYEAHFNELVAGKNWKITKTAFPNEIAFLIQK
jgi:16S rRNA (guanine(1405)-N(7))-methyltransferase